MIDIIFRNAKGRYGNEGLFALDKGKLLQKSTRDNKIFWKTNEASVDTFENDGALYDINNRIEYYLFEDHSFAQIELRKGLGLEVQYDTKVTSIDELNNQINNVINIYGYNKIISIDLASEAYDGIVDASKLTIPASVFNLNNLFENWTSLEKAPTIPITVITIDECFFNCPNLGAITYAGTLEQFKQINKYYSCGDNGLIVHCTDGDYIVGE